MTDSTSRFLSENGKSNKIDEFGRGNRNGRTIFRPCSLDFDEGNIEVSY
jgi:hypothetical protein